MTRKKKLIACGLSITFLISFFISCSQLGLFGRGSDFAAFSQLPSWDENEGTIPNDKFFYIRLAKENYTGHNFLQHAMYEIDGGPGTDCKIPVDKESTEDIFCMLEKLEGDLWAHETPIEYNVPPSMCKYLSVQVPWHFNQNAGKGPKIISQCEEPQAATTADEDPEIEEKYCIGGTCPTSCATGSCPAVGANKCASEVEDLCSYDLSHQEGLANCCYGTYEVRGDDSSDGEWGDNIANCLGGLGRVNWDTKTKLGIPATRVISAEKDGYIGVYRVPSIDSFYDGGSPYTRISGPSFAVANYYEDIENFDLSKLPKLYTTEKLHNQGDTTEQAIKGYPYFTISCLDSGHESLHRIHLIIREWNTEEEFNKFVESEGSRGDPDEGGDEGIDCDYYELADNISDTDKDYFIFHPCDDAADLDDWLRNVPSEVRYPHVQYN